MSYVDSRAKELVSSGIYSAEQARADVLHKIVNMDEWDYYNIEIQTLESYLGILSQQAMYLQQLCNMAEAKEIELGNEFKMSALPLVLGSKIRSVEERWVFASTLTDDLENKFKAWQQAVIESVLMKDLAKPTIEKINVIKKVYDDRRMEGQNRHIHKYTEGS